MRATIFAATLVCLGLAGCDDSSKAPAPTLQAVAPPCNCEAPTPPLTRLAPPHASHRHARTASYSESYRENDESYSYRSQSRSSYQSESGDQGYDQDESRGNAEENGWVDGYGRSHFVATASAASDDRARLAPWHGYDQDCDDQDSR